MRPVKFKDVVSVGLARDAAPEVLSSEAVEERLGQVYERLRLPRGLLASLTGILRRRLYPLDWKPSQAAVRAAEKLLTQTGFDRNRLDLL
jgi:3-oxoacyl-[acyl-carrier-protein] synthase III